MATFTGKRRRRPRLIALGVVAALATVLGLVAAVVTIGARAEAWLPWLAIGGMVAFYGLMIGAMVPRRAEIRGYSLTVTTSRKSSRSGRLTS